MRKLTKEEFEEACDCVEQVWEDKQIAVQIADGILDRELKSLPVMGSDLRKARESTGMTMRDFARKAGISHTYVSLLEAGKRRPTQECALRILRVLRVKM